MGDQAVVVTGVMIREGDDFKVRYEIRRFKHDKFCYCIYCDPQMGDPSEGYYDLAEHTLRCQFDPLALRKRLMLIVGQSTTEDQLS